MNSSLGNLLPNLEKCLGRSGSGKERRFGEKCEKAHVIDKETEKQNRVL